MKYKKILLVLPILIIITLLSLAIQSLQKPSSAKTSKGIDSTTDVLATPTDINACLQDKQKYENKTIPKYSDIDYVDDEVYYIIKKAYDEVDFMGEFKVGNKEVYDSYREQYLRVIKCEATFFDKQTQKEYYLDEFKEMDYTLPGVNLIYGGTYSDIYNPSNYAYYFFDMDDDGAPEICITNEIRFIYYKI